MGAGGLGWSRRYPQAAAAAECVHDVAVVVAVVTIYKYKEKILYAITVFRVPVKVPKTKSLKLGPAAARP